LFIEDDACSRELRAHRLAEVIA
jgi:hypothetical protein